MTLIELLKSDDMLWAVYQEASAFRVLDAEGKPARIVRWTMNKQTGDVVARPGAQERASALRLDEGFCAEQLWKARPQSHGYVGMKFLANQCIDRNEKLWPHRDIILQGIFEAIPSCAHPITEKPYEVDLGNGQKIKGVEVQGHAGHDYPLTEAGPGAINRGQWHVKKDRTIVLNTTPPFRSLVDMLSHDDDEALAEVPLAGMTQDLGTGEWRWKLPKDEGDPVYIVLSDWEAKRLAQELEYPERFKRGEISARYLKESIYVCGPDERDLLLSADLTKHTITGYLSYKPVVLTFSDQELEDKLASVCKAVATVLPIEPKVTDAVRRSLQSKPANKLFALSQSEYDLIGGFNHWWPTLAAFRAPFKPVGGTLEASVADMPKEVLDGWLGEVCRTRMAAFPLAYAWPALLAMASVLVPPCEGRARPSIYVVLVGPPGSGKSSAFDYALYLLNLQKPPLLGLKAGSAEGLIKVVGDAGGAARLFYPGELSHLLKKASIEGSTFASTLNDLYYWNEQDVVIAAQKQLRFNARLSIAGGIPENEFMDLFGAETQHGFYRRCLLSTCPTGFALCYRPPESGGPPVLKAPAFSEAMPDALAVAQPGTPIPVTVDESVWAERDRWAKDYGIDASAAGEHAIRAAIICAAFDGRGTLSAKDLGPALALARYENELRKTLAPNPGKNVGGILTAKIVNYLKKHAPTGQWVSKRVMLNSINAFVYGADASERVINGLVSAGEIQISKNGRQPIVRLNIERMD